MSHPNEQIGRASRWVRTRGISKDKRLRRRYLRRKTRLDVENAPAYNRYRGWWV